MTNPVEVMNHFKTNCEEQQMFEIKVPFMRKLTFC